ncbi:MAG: polyprenyl synthetase family protein [Mesorhizobium sp.]|nr:polyprenyl synthetase family protein [Mesorhizobium sp.]
MSGIQQRTEVALAAALPSPDLAPTRLHLAMRYAVLGGGKRVRPLLCHAAGAVFGVDSALLDAPSVAVELIHAYSLVHDDLPCMDDDVLRRGKPTCHVEFDEATALLVGDALQAHAFQTLASRLAGIAPARQLEMLHLLAAASGSRGMAGGQALDLDAAIDRPGEAGIITLQAMKTGALIRFACEAGAIVGGAAPSDRERLAEFGSAIGLAFQLADDLLDLTADSSAMGKATGKDAAAGKATLPALHGADWTRRQLAGLVAQAHDLLRPFGDSAALLKAAATFVAERKS